jgi:glycosyltransferase involved in cell wall biosynthesis
MRPRAIVAVTNDLSTDNRVHRTCMVLLELGYDVLLVGRQLPHSLPIERPYATHRMRLLFNKGALFYAEYNIRLFFFLVFSGKGKTGESGKGGDPSTPREGSSLRSTASPLLGARKRSPLIVANDLDTLLASHLAAKVRGTHLVYDSHEYFTEVPELAGRSARKVWLAIERWIFPKLQHIITVNESIANAYHQRYPHVTLSPSKGNRDAVRRAHRDTYPIHVIRNIPMHRELGPLSTRKQLCLPEDKFILILQGSGINVQRGGEEAVQAMAHLPEAYLLIIGGGDAWPVLKDIVAGQRLEHRVRLIGRKPYEEMMQYTRNADLGLSLDKDTNLNYRFSLPNKLFDYFRAHIPVLATDLPEVAAIVRRYDAGIIIARPVPQLIASHVKELITNAARRHALRQNAIFAANSLDGEREKDALKALFQRLD